LTGTRFIRIGFYASYQEVIVPAAGSFRRHLIVLAGVASLAGTAAVQAQPSAPTPQPAPAVSCPPDMKGPPPTVGGPPSADLSDRLADSKGVICPPAGLDPDIHVTPPEGGEIKIIPPPGSGGGRPDVEPK
jgi:hypothetical protein